MSHVKIPLWVARAMADPHTSNSVAVDLLNEAILEARIRPITPRSSGLLGKTCLVTVEGDQVEGIIIQDKPAGGALEVAVRADIPTGVDHVEVALSDASILVTGEEAVRDVIAGWHETWARLTAEDPLGADPLVEALKMAHDSVEAALNV